MTQYTWFATLALAALLGACAHGQPSVVTDPARPRSLPEAGPVQVSWTDPEGFSEIRHSGSSWTARRGDWVRQLAEHLRARSAARIGEGERLSIEITDIQRAGDFEPWRTRGDDIRIMRDIYPPRISLRFTLTGADGRVIAEGERRLSDTAYLMRSGIGDSDPLRFEQRMLDEWVRREFPRNDG